ncbi:2,3-diaminopropionate biosynthesis protein SbnB [Bradyrhizobium sp.]
MPASELAVRQFDVVSAAAIKRILSRSIHHTVRLVENVYMDHADGRSVNPDSYFLRFPNEERNRIIALPAHIAGGRSGTATGIKWISSFPDNGHCGLPRASATLILNDPGTGFPIACLEGAHISAARTAASAVSAAYRLNGKDRNVNSIGLIGAGVIGRTVLRFLFETGWTCRHLRVFDLNRNAAEAVLNQAEQNPHAGSASYASLEQTIRQSDLVIFATTSNTPYVNNADSFSHRPIVLHISLRDLSPEIILNSHNVVDDVDHCLKADTSTHLAERIARNREFIDSTLPAILNGHPAPDRSRPIIFSPFGMGILDIALASYVYETAKAEGNVVSVPEFFADQC